MLPTLLKRRPTPLVLFARSCSRHYSTSPRPNEELIQLLTRYMEEEKASASSNAYKVRAYSKAISAIGQLSEQVQSVDQVKNLDGIGARIAKRIDAYLCGVPYQPPTSSKPRNARNLDHSLQEHTGTKHRKTLDELRRKQVVSSLSSISGIGPSIANALYDAGCRSLQDLREPKFFQMLRRAQQVNVQYMISPDRHVSHEQALAVRDFITQNISSKFTVLLSGHFRRGAGSAQRIKLLILHPQSTPILPPKGSPGVDSTITQIGGYQVIPSPFATRPGIKANAKSPPDTVTFSTEILSPLECRGLLATAITTGAHRWDGIIRIPERPGGDGWETQADRIRAVQECQGQFFGADIYYVPRACAGAALIALTGDLGFNLSLRKAASHLGLRLNEYGLWRWRSAATPDVDHIEIPESVGEHGGHWELVTSEREEDIFEALRMEWVVPERRNFSNLNTRLGKRKGDI